MCVLVSSFTYVSTGCCYIFAYAYDCICLYICLTCVFVYLSSYLYLSMRTLSFRVEGFRASFGLNLGCRVDSLGGSRPKAYSLGHKVLVVGLRVWASGALGHTRNSLWGP